MKEGELVKIMFTPFWFLQLWIQQYFPDFLAIATLTRIIQSAVYGDYYTWFPFLSFSTYEVANTLIQMRVRTFTQLCPYQDQGCGLTWIQQRLFLATNLELSEVTLQ